MNTYICSRCGQTSYSAASLRRLRNRTKRTVARAVCGLSGLAMLLIVGGLENFWLPLWPGALWLAISFVVFALSAMKGELLNVRR